MKPKNEVKHLRGYIETIEKKYRELEAANAALLEALEAIRTESLEAIRKASQ